MLMLANLKIQGLKRGKILAGLIGVSFLRGCSTGMACVRPSNSLLRAHLGNNRYILIKIFIN